MDTEIVAFIRQIFSGVRDYSFRAIQAASIGSIISFQIEMVFKSQLFETGYKVVFTLSVKSEKKFR